MFNATPLWIRVVIAAPRSNIVALALVGSILTLMLTACGSSGNADGSIVSTQAIEPTQSAQGGATTVATPPSAPTFTVGNTTVSAQCSNVSYIDEYGNKQYLVNVDLTNTGSQYDALIHFVYLNIYSTSGHVIARNWNEISPDFDTPEGVTLSPGGSTVLKDGGNVGYPFGSCKVVGITT